MGVMMTAVVMAVRRRSDKEARWWCLARHEMCWCQSERVWVLIRSSRCWEWEKGRVEQEEERDRVGIG